MESFMKFNDEFMSHSPSCTQFRCSKDGQAVGTLGLVILRCKEEYVFIIPD
ncbi:unnamed protein product [Brassica napus]|nr:unnamed protein product [Brassica napus]